MNTINDFYSLIEKCKFDIPKTENGCFFKYIPITEHHLISLLNDELYFADYSKLNDPLECFFMKKEEWFKKCLENENITPRILSLTEVNDSKLMYSHYANSHTGLCVEYKLDFETLENQSKFAWGSVKYKSRQSRVEDLRDLYMLKNKDWNYEKEFRIIRFDNEKFLKGIIQSITFGYKCDQRSRQLICTLLKSKKNIQYYEMSEKDNSNDLERKIIRKAESQKYIIK